MESSSPEEGHGVSTGVEEEQGQRDEHGQGRDRSMVKGRGKERAEVRARAGRMKG